MKLTTKLTGNGRAGKIEIVVKTDSKKDYLTRDEAVDRHNTLVQGVHETMTARGCWAQYIKVS